MDSTVIDPTMLDSFMSTLPPQHLCVFLSQGTPEPREGNGSIIMPMGFVRAGWRADVSHETQVAIALGALVDRRGATRYLGYPLGLAWLNVRGILDSEWLDDHFTNRFIPWFDKHFSSNILGDLNSTEAFVDHLVAADSVRIVPGINDDPGRALEELADCWLVPLVIPRATMTNDTGRVLYTDGIAAPRDDEIEFGVLEIPRQHAMMLTSGIGQQLGRVRDRWDLDDATVLNTLCMLVSNGVVALLPEGPVGTR